MEWAVDKIEDNIVIIENTQTLERKEVDKELLPSSIHEGSILIYKDKEYYLNQDKEILRRKEIEERFKRLRNNN